MNNLHYQMTSNRSDTMVVGLMIEHLKAAIREASHNKSKTAIKKFYAESRPFLDALQHIEMHEASEFQAEDILEHYQEENNLCRRNTSEDIKKLTANRSQCLKEILEKLRLTEEELQRIENEGGLPPTKAQEQESSAHLKARQRIEELILLVEEKLLPNTNISI